MDKGYTLESLRGIKDTDFVIHYPDASRSEEDPLLKTGSIASNLSCSC
jgi:hypothetical protein